MSAYMVSKETLDGVLLAGLSIAYRPGGSPLRWVDSVEPDGTFTATTLVAETASRTGAMLWAENRESVNVRYGEDELEDFYTFEVEPSEVFIPDPVKVLKLLSHYEYQACESRAYGISEACRFIETLRAAIIATLPGMASAPWGIESLDDIR